MLSNSEIYLNRSIIEAVATHNTAAYFFGTLCTCLQIKIGIVAHKVQAYVIGPYYYITDSYCLLANSYRKPAETT